MKNYKWLIIFLIFVLLAVVFWLKVSNVGVVKDSENKFSENQNQNNQIENNNEPQVSINGQTFFVEMATESAVQKKGLSGRSDLSKDRGMLFDFGYKDVLSFWMVDMKFNIDLLWINDDKIVGIEKNMLAPAPGTQDKDLAIYESPEPVNRVLEINSGLADQYGIKVGDKLEYKNINF